MVFAQCRGLSMPNSRIHLPSLQGYACDRGQAGEREQPRMEHVLAAATSLQRLVVGTGRIATTLQRHGAPLRVQPLEIVLVYHVVVRVVLSLAGSARARPGQSI